MARFSTIWCIIRLTACPPSGPLPNICLTNACTRTCILKRYPLCCFALFAVREVISSACESNETMWASSRLFSPALTPFPLCLCHCLSLSLSLSVAIHRPSWQNRDPIAREFHSTNRLGTKLGIGNPESLNSIGQKGRERACERSFREVRRPYGVFRIANSFLLRSN